MILYAFMPGLSKADIRTTTCFLNLTTFPFRVLFGILLGVVIPEEWLIYLLMMVGSVVGTYLGDRLHRKVSTQVVLGILMTLVLASSATLCRPGDGSEFGWIVLPFFALVPFLLLYMGWLYWRLAMAKKLTTQKHAEFLESDADADHHPQQEMGTVLLLHSPETAAEGEAMEEREEHVPLIPEVLPVQE